MRKAYGGVGLRERDRRRLPGEYDFDLERDRDRERLWEERDLLRLLERESIQDQMCKLAEQHPQFLIQPWGLYFSHPASSQDSAHCTLPGLGAWIRSWSGARARSWPRIGARWFWRSWIGPGGWATSAFRPTARPRRPTAQIKADKLQWNSWEKHGRCKYTPD